MSAIRHWIALDEAVSRILPESVAARARERFAHHAAALTDIYVARLLKTIDGPAADTGLARHVRELHLTQHALTDALARAWNTDPDLRTDSRTNCGLGTTDEDCNQSNGRG